MPYAGGGTPINWQLWYKCRDQAAAQMIEEGWNKHARKFNEVRMRRARRLYLGR